MISCVYYFCQNTLNKTIVEIKTSNNKRAFSVQNRLGTAYLRMIDPKLQPGDPIHADIYLLTETLLKEVLKILPDGPITPYSFAPGDQMAAVTVHAGKPGVFLLSIRPVHVYWPPPKPNLLFLEDTKIPHPTIPGATTALALGCTYRVNFDIVFRVLILIRGYDQD